MFQIAEASDKNWKEKKKEQMCYIERQKKGWKTNIVSKKKKEKTNLSKLVKTNTVDHHLCN